MNIGEVADYITENLADPRRTSSGHFLHILGEIIVISLLAILSGVKSFRGMEIWAIGHKQQISRFLKLPNGIPDADTIRRCFERLNPQLLYDVLYNSVDNIDVTGRHIAVDGKSIKGSKNEEHSAYHILTGFLTDTQMVLGQVTVPKKANEITEAPLLFDFFNIKGSTISADAILCQKGITNLIASKGADFVIALKKNQPTLYDDIDLYVHNNLDKLVCKIDGPKKGHGRIETRTYYFIPDFTSLFEISKEWPSVKSIAIVKSEIEKKGVLTTEFRYYITSLDDFEKVSKIIRRHWSIENGLHYCLDVFFDEDDCKAKKRHSPENLNIARKFALGLLHKVKANSNPSLRLSYISLMQLCDANIYFIQRVLKGETILKL